jgi:uncharacterized protein (DUF983 family)
MAISARCPKCDKAYLIVENAQGKEVTCRVCHNQFTVPAPQPDEAADALANLAHRNRQPDGLPQEPVMFHKTQWGPLAGGRRTRNFAPCPLCSSTLAVPIRWTWWGGVLGPILCTHVRCMMCGAKYNGKTGKSNFDYIVIFTVFSIILVWILYASLLR